MTTATKYPRIQNVTPQCGKTLLVTFENGVRKVYDCGPLLQRDVFRALQDDAVFRCAHADSHGYGVVWNDDIDLAESEIWINGQPAEQRGGGDGIPPPHR